MPFKQRKCLGESRLILGDSLASASALKMCGCWFVKVFPSFVCCWFFFVETRKDEVCSIRSKFPNKLPVSCFFFSSQAWCIQSPVLLVLCAAEADPWCVFVFRWLLNVTLVKRLSPCWTKQSSWSPLSSPWVSSCASSGKPLTAFRHQLLSTVSSKLPESPLTLTLSFS